MTSEATALDLRLVDSQQPQTPCIKGEQWICVARIGYFLKLIYFQQKLIISIRILLLYCDQCQCQ